MTIKLNQFDVAKYLDNEESIATFIAEAFKTEDAKFIAHALGVAARAKGMTEIAKQTGLSREHLYRSLSENGNPTLQTTLSIMKALGVDLTATVHNNHQNN